MPDLEVSNFGNSGLTKFICNPFGALKNTKIAEANFSLDLFSPGFRLFCARNVPGESFGAPFGKFWKRLTADLEVANLGKSAITKFVRNFKQTSGILKFTKTRK